MIDECRNKVQDMRNSIKRRNGEKRRKKKEEGIGCIESFHSYNLTTFLLSFSLSFSLSVSVSVCLSLSLSLPPSLLLCLSIYLSIFLNFTLYAHFQFYSPSQFNSHSLSYLCGEYLLLIFLR